MSEERGKSILDALIRTIETDRLAEAEESAREYLAEGDPKPLEALPVLIQSIEAGEVGGWACNECDSWDGRSRRCTCGNRRVYWAWDGSRWHPEAY